MPKTNETRLMQEIELALSGAGHQVFRCNVGKVRTPDGSFFATGLPKGHSDLYGFRRDGQIFYVEVKVRPNRPTPEQLRFIEMMERKGALAGVAYTVEEALEIAGRTRAGGTCTAY